MLRRFVREKDVHALGNALKRILHRGEEGYGLLHEFLNSEVLIPDSAVLKDKRLRACMVSLARDNAKALAGVAGYVSEATERPRHEGGR